MPANYDKYHQTENLFGEPYPELMTFFENYNRKETLIDVCCGQGRDCISLARMGYTVTGIDNSKIKHPATNQRQNNGMLSVAILHLPQAQHRPPLTELNSISMELLSENNQQKNKRHSSLNIP